MRFLISWLIVWAMVMPCFAGETKPVLDLEASIVGDLVHTNKITLGPLILYDVVSHPTLTNNVLSFSNCQANVYGGTAKGTLTIDFERNRMTVSASVKGADLGTVLAAYGGNAETYSGVIAGDIELTFPIGKPEEAEGRGRLTITQGNLIELSFLTNLLIGDIANVRNQDQAEAIFELVKGSGNNKESSIRLTSARVIMPKGILLASGTIQLDGSLRLLVIPRVSGGLLSQVWFVGKWFGSALAFASSHIARTVVRGNISKPVVVMNPFASN
jgi:hypothetical protein